MPGANERGNANGIHAERTRHERTEEVRRHLQAEEPRELQTETPHNQQQVPAIRQDDSIEERERRRRRNPGQIDLAQDIHDGMPVGPPQDRREEAQRNQQRTQREAKIRKRQLLRISPSPGTRGLDTP